MKFSDAAIFSLFALAHGHGTITSPPSRAPGDAMKAACGEQVYNNQKGDNKGNVQGILQVAKNQKDFNQAQCNVWLCKGYQFADNAANVQSYSAGQTVNMRINIAAPHTGVANVSVVDTATNAVIGSPLISFDDYASNAHTIPETNKAFSFQMPNVGSQCGAAGACTIQWFWNAPDIQQTYEGCVDFTMGGGGGAAPAAPAAPAAGSAAPAAPGNPGSKFAGGPPKQAGRPWFMDYFNRYRPNQGN